MSRVVSATATTATDADAGIRIVVAPAQSSFYAGEPLAVSITFTNIRSVSSASSTSKPKNTHKRAAHSISSAPLSKPPTSPGPPRTPVASSSSAFTRPAFSRQNSNGLPSRKGQIGKTSANGAQGLLEKRREQLLSNGKRPLSISIGETEAAEIRSASYMQTNFTESGHSPSSPRVPSPLTRSSTLALSSSHPHARKQSVFDGQLQLQEISSPTSTTTSMPPYTPTSSTSSFTLPLDSISEAPVPTHEPYKLGLGRPPMNRPIPPRTAFSSTFPQSSAELILYSYVQFSGNISLSPSPPSPPTAEQQNNIHTLRTSLHKRKIRGGGSMDISTLLGRPDPLVHRRNHSRASSFSGSLLSMLSPSALVSSVSSPSAIGGGSADAGDVDPHAPLPTFDVQPAMLAVDLSLLPGESRTYTYTVTIPANLPPTFRGRLFSCSYELAIGTCRAGSGGSNISRVMKVPIRLYNNVSIGRSSIPYDLLWPVKKPPGPVAGKVVEAKKDEPGFGNSGSSITGLGLGPIQSPGKSAIIVDSGMENLREYADRLVSSVRNAARALPLERALSMEEEDDWAMRGSPTGDEGSGCREAVEILTRNPKKASYDVNKDGVKVAILTFPKTSYRLGETVSGIVEINPRDSRTRVLQLSAILETQESLPSSLASPSNSRQLRRVHADHHSSFTLSTLRTTFSLDIPSDASPAFQIESSASSLGGLGWKVRLCLLVAIAEDSCDVGTEGVRMRSLELDGMRGEWGTSWKAPSDIAPLARTKAASPQQQPPPPASQGWASYITSSILGIPDAAVPDEEEEIYDGIKPDPDGGVGLGVDFSGGEEGWREVRVETVECEVPITVWPGNTAFKVSDVIFNV